MANWLRISWSTAKHSLDPQSYYQHCWLEYIPVMDEGNSIPFRERNESCIDATAFRASAKQADVRFTSGESPKIRPTPAAGESAAPFRSWQKST